MGDDVRELLGCEDVVEPSKDGLLGPVLDADSAGHVVDEMIFDIGA